MNQKFSFENTKFDEAFIVNPFVAEDNRGYFIKDYSKETFLANNIDHNLEEVFYTKSKKGVLRAIHFQRNKQQSKLVRCVFGKVFDVIVDLRKNSPTFGDWEGFYLSEHNKKEIFVPKNFGHGYLVLEPSIVSYKCGEKFYEEFDDGIIWNDSDININWPLDLVDNKIILSERDKTLQTFKEFKLKY